MLCMELAAALDQGDQRGMRKVAASLIRETIKGNIAAVKEIADRIDGKVPRAQIIRGDDDGGRVRYYAEMPEPCSSMEGWVKGNAAYLSASKRRAKPNQLG